MRHILSPENLMQRTRIWGIHRQRSYVEAALLLLHYTLQTFYFKFLHCLLNCAWVQISAFQRETDFPPALVLSSLCPSPTPWWPVMSGDRAWHNTGILPHKRGRTTMRSEGEHWFSRLQNSIYHCSLEEQTELHENLLLWLLSFRRQKWKVLGKRTDQLSYQVI